MKSIMALSMHKAGSSIADLIFNEVAKARGYEIDRISTQVPGSSLSEPEIFHRYQRNMKTEGIYYGIARNPDTHDMEILPKLRLLIQVRDPRDCITSLYYSRRFSHAPPQDPEKLKAFEEARARFDSIDVDTFSAQNAPSYLKRLQKLEALASNHPDLRILTYEEMVDETENWLDKALDIFGQPRTESLDRALERHLNFKTDTEDVLRHKRQVTPGDHRRKLRPETIARMNEVLEPALRSFGYPA